VNDPATGNFSGNEDNSVNDLDQQLGQRRDHSFQTDPVNVDTQRRRGRPGRRRQSKPADPSAPTRHDFGLTARH
jgi:hypothetical protein